tara:strand:+ start:1801 stop:2748 length:948 start_codon:yes stop_codon:yes gene_type:complete
MKKIKYISLSGGGMKGVMYIGAYRSLLHHFNFKEQMENIEGIVGTSIGAIFSLAMLLRLTDEQVMNIFLPIASAFENIAPQMDISLLLHKFGSDDGQTFRYQLGQILMQCGLSSDITFSQFKKICACEFICISTKLRTQETIYVSAKTFPDLRIIDGIFMSMCVPLLFRPFEYDGELYVDGYLTQNQPIYYDPQLTLSFAFVMKHLDQIDNWQTFLQCVITACISCQRKCTEEYLNECEENVIYLDYPKDMVRQGTIDRYANELNNKRFVNCGYLSVLKLRYPKINYTMEEILKMVIKVHENYYCDLSNECDEHL